MPVGDSTDERSVEGPLIVKRQVEPVLGLIREAAASGARVLTSGNAVGNVVEPTAIVDGNAEFGVAKDEVFRPVTTLEAFSDFDDAVRKTNATRFGLQPILFPRDTARALAAFERLGYGGVLVDEPPTFRADNVPYRSVKDSGRRAKAFA